MVENLLDDQMDKNSEEWLEKNKEAIDEYAKFIDLHGCFGDTLRCF